MACVFMTDADKRELQGDISKLSEEKANRIVETASGETIVVTDSSEAKPLGLAIDGKSEQNQYSGKNLVENTQKSGIYKGVTFVINEDGTAIFNGTATEKFELIFNDNVYLEAGKYVLNGCPSSGSDSTYRLACYFLDGSGLFYVDTGSSVTFEITSPVSMKVYAVVNASVTASNLVFKPMISVDGGTYEPYCGGIPSPNPQYKQEIRNIGVYDEASGKYAVEVKCATEDGSKETTATVLLDEPLRKEDKAYWNGGSKVRDDRYRDVEVFDGSDDEGWVAQSTKTSGNFRWTVVTNSKYKPITATNVVASVLCDQFIPKSFNNVYDENQGISVDSSGNFSIYDESCKNMTIAEWKAHLAENPITVEYELATPITEEIDIDLGELSMFYPTTVISNDCNANMEVEYIADTKAYIDKKFAELATAMV